MRAALNIVLHVIGGAFVGRHADAEILRRLDDFARAEINARLAQRVALDQQMVPRHPAILEHDLAVVHEAAADRLVAARDGQPGVPRGTMKLEVPCIMPTPGLVLA